MTKHRQQHTRGEYRRHLSLSGQGRVWGREEEEMANGYKLKRGAQLIIILLCIYTGENKLQ